MGREPQDDPYQRMLLSRGEHGFVLLVNESRPLILRKFIVGDVFWDLNV